MKLSEFEDPNISSRFFETQTSVLFWLLSDSVLIRFWPGFCHFAKLAFKMAKIFLKSLLVLISLFFVLLVSPTDGQEYDTQAYLRLLKNNSSLRNVYLPHLNGYIRQIDLLLNDDDRTVSAKCQKDLKHLRQGLLNTEEFALNCEYY